MLEVPAHGLSQAALERVARRPSELAANLRRVDRVPAIVAGTIGHERLQPAAAFSLGLQLVDDIADAIDEVEVRSFVAAADIILLAHEALGEDEQQSSASHIRQQPVAASPALHS